MLLKISTIIATCCYIGKFKFFPGSLGALLGCLIYYIFFDVLYINICILAILLILGYASTAVYIKRQEQKDPKEVIIDEVVGQHLALLIINQSSIISIFIIFILFRILDIAKPLGIGYIDKRFKSATGVMLDDIAAGICAAALYSAISLLLVYAKSISF